MSLFKTLLKERVAPAKKFCEYSRGYNHNNMEAVRIIEPLLELIDEMAKELDVRSRDKKSHQRTASK